VPLPQGADVLPFDVRSGDMRSGRLRSGCQAGRGAEASAPEAQGAEVHLMEMPIRR